MKNEIRLFLLYENNDKYAPLGLSYLFSGLTVLAYFLVNVVVLKDYALWDILYLVALVFYAFTFRIRNLSLMRLIMTIPTGLSVVYGFGIGATAFVIVSYVFEFCANLLAIIRQDVLPNFKSKASIENK